jgi:transposase-like protein
LSYCVDAAIGRLASWNPRRTLGLLSLALQEAGSVSALARSLGCERKTLQRYLAQERAPEFVPAVSRDLQSHTQPPAPRIARQA